MQNSALNFVSWNFGRSRFRGLGFRDHRSSTTCSQRVQTATRPGCKLYRTTGVHNSTSKVNYSCIVGAPLFAAVLTAALWNCTLHPLHTMNTHIHTYIHTYIHIYTYTYIHTYIHIYTHV